jgi:hypothetical protein
VCVCVVQALQRLALQRLMLALKIKSRKLICIAGCIYLKFEAPGCCCLSPNWCSLEHSCPTPRKETTQNTDRRPPLGLPHAP